MAPAPGFAASSSLGSPAGATQDSVDVSVDSDAAGRHAHLPAAFDMLDLDLGIGLNLNLTPTALLVVAVAVALVLVYVSFNIRKHRWLVRCLLFAAIVQTYTYRAWSARDGTARGAIAGFDKNTTSTSTPAPAPSAGPTPVTPETLNSDHDHPYPFNMPDPDATPPAVLKPQTHLPAAHSGPSSSITLRQGRYTGVVIPGADPASSSATSRHAVEAWRGIPYAQTTGGQNRFRPPVPLEPYARQQSFNADKFGPFCPGTTSRAKGMVEAEDCLNLNVYRQAGYDAQRDGKLPVVVYVHGGAFNGGSGVERDMASFVGWAKRGVIGVNFNYRVGVLGFPSSGLAETEGVLNLGLRDQQLLFEWVGENIGAFGGDGQRVTVMGMSAGAHSIGYHLQSYTDPATAPFQAAIMESGGPTARATLSPTHPRTESQWREFLTEAGINSKTSDPAQIFNFLRSLPVEKITRASNAVFVRYQDPIRWPFQPVIDSRRERPIVVPDLPIESFRTGRYLKIPILTGFNTNEGTVFVSRRINTNEQFLSKFTTMIPGLTTPDLKALAALYPDPVTNPRSRYATVPPGFGRQWSRYEAAYAHYAYICPVLQTGHFYSNDATAPVYVYRFAALSRPDFGGKANHVDEAVVVAHDTRAIGKYPGLMATSEAMHGAWVNFIATGNPNGAKGQEEKWPRFRSPFAGNTGAERGRLRRREGAGEEEAYGQVMVFGSGNDERMGGGKMGVPTKVVRMTEGEQDECRFWWERVDLSEGMGKRLDATRARL